MIPVRRVVLQEREVQQLRLEVLGDQVRQQCFIETFTKKLDQFTHN